MAILRFRNQNAEKLEEQAKEKHQARVEQDALQKTRQGVISPPPGAELLGKWLKVEVSSIIDPTIVAWYIVFDYLVIDRVEPNGHFFGYSILQGKLFSLRLNSIVERPSLRNVRAFTLTGRIIKPGFARTKTVPCFGGIQCARNLLAGPCLGEISWDQHRMVGYDYNELGKSVDSYVAVKVS